uniref:Uncharacterized protein n=1 Tax=Eutreptiella gymnastica TaxID=73025 RepID=A0A7S1IHW2_9EUGL|mmetsp:Transcript_19664/g.34928  ORF Transcript_19664/g.34928 Transcript_19664/m.34928 type:complete len:331 (+) Transcript_19664:2-994(+)
MSISTVFMFAILTQRALLTDGQGFYAPMSALFKNPGFAWTQPTMGGGAGTRTITNPASGVWMDTEPLLCADYSSVYTQGQISIRTNQYMVPYMFYNPHYHDDLVDIFGDDIFHPITRMLFRPIQELIQARDAFVAQHFANSYVVGLQIRSGHDFTSNFMDERAFRLYGDCAVNSTPVERRKDLKYFVATDTPQGRKAARQYLGDQVFFYKDFQISNNPEGVQRALLDILLLAAAKDRVHTAWSSYGYTAAGMAGRPPNMVVDAPGSPLIAPAGQEQLYMGVKHKSDRRVQCVRLPTHQPCFHKFMSWGANKASCYEKKWMQKEMLNGRYC